MRPASPIRDNPVKTSLAAGGRSGGAMAFEFFTPGLPQLCVHEPHDHRISLLPTGTSTSRLPFDCIGETSPARSICSMRRAARL